MSPSSNYEALRQSFIASLEAAIHAHESGDLAAISRGYDRLDGELLRGADPRFDKLHVALEFWDGWIDARNHEWLHYPGIAAGDWPRLARGIVDDLRTDRDIGDEIVLEHFDFRRRAARPSLLTQIKTMFRRAGDGNSSSRPSDAGGSTPEESAHPKGARPGAVIVTHDKQRLTTFYRTMTGLPVHANDDSITVLASEHFELVIHALPGEPAGSLFFARTDAYVKPFFPVASLADARARAASLGGNLWPASEEWSARGFRACEAVDPDGNVIQFRERAS